MALLENRFENCSVAVLVPWVPPVVTLAPPAGFGATGIFIRVVFGDCVKPLCPFGRNLAVASRDSLSRSSCICGVAMPNGGFEAVEVDSMPLELTAATPIMGLLALAIRWLWRIEVGCPKPELVTIAEGATVAVGNEEP